MALADVSVWINMQDKYSELTKNLSVLILLIKKPD